MSQEEDASLAFQSARNIWKQRTQGSDPHTSPPKSRVRDIVKCNQPPLSPSSRGMEAIDPFQAYGVVFNSDTGGAAMTALTVKKLIPGSSADLAGVLFPGDTLHELEGMNVFRFYQAPPPPPPRCPALPECSVCLCVHGSLSGSYTAE